MSTRLEGPIWPRSLPAQVSRYRQGCGPQGLSASLAPARGDGALRPDAPPPPGGPQTRVTPRQPREALEPVEPCPETWNMRLTGVTAAPETARPSQRGVTGSALAREGASTPQSCQGPRGKTRTASPRTTGMRNSTSAAIARLAAHWLKC